MGVSLRYAYLSVYEIVDMIHRAWQFPGSGQAYASPH